MYWNTYSDHYKQIKVASTIFLPVWKGETVFVTIRFITCKCEFNHPGTLFKYSFNQKMLKLYIRLNQLYSVISRASEILLFYVI